MFLYRLATNITYIVDKHLEKCSCSFFANYGLPCRHILYFAVLHAVVLDPVVYSSRWNFNLSKSVCNVEGLCSGGSSEKAFLFYNLLKFSGHVNLSKLFKCFFNRMWRDD